MCIEMLLLIYGPQIFTMWFVLKECSYALNGTALYQMPVDHLLNLFIQSIFFILIILQILNYGGCCSRVFKLDNENSSLFFLIFA